MDRWIVGPEEVMAVSERRLPVQQLVILCECVDYWFLVMDRGHETASSLLRKKQRFDNLARMSKNK